MYGFPQAGILAEQLLEESLPKHGNVQIKITPGLWKHKRRPIRFTLVVDNFGVKYQNKEYTDHFVSLLK